jgi:hypothetical protein
MHNKTVKIPTLKIDHLIKRVGIWRLFKQQYHNIKEQL